MKEKEYIEELKDKYGITEFGLPKELEGEEPDEVQEIFLSEGDLYDKNEKNARAACTGIYQSIVRKYAAMGTWMERLPES